MDLFFPRKDRLLHARWFAMLWLVCLLLVTGRNFAQDSDFLAQKITYKAHKLALSTVLKEVRKKANVRFSYNSEVVGRQPLVTINVTGMPLRDFLHQLLDNCGLQFGENLGVIIIYEKKEERSAMVDDKGAKPLSVVLRGQVTDPRGMPLAGVSIRGLESREMTVTRDDGIFVLIAREQETVNFSLMGMKSFTYKAGSRPESFLSFKMDTVMREIQEVVITGYQKIDPRLATGSYTRLKGTDVLQPGVASVDQMLQGKVPGLMVINTSGSVNAQPKMRIRGTSTLVGNASPLIVVDGMIRPDPVNIEASVLNNLVSDAANANYELMGNAISGINVFDIENLTFLRDAAATAIYGTRAANGVIVINTKRGKVGAMQVNYNANVSFQARPTYNKMRLMNSKERVELSRQLESDGIVSNPVYSGFREMDSYEGLRYALYGRKITQAEFDQKVAELETNNTDWFKVLFRNQLGTQHNLSVSGGAGKTTYYASINYAKNNSAAKMDGNTRYGAQVAIRSELGKRLSLDLSMSSNVSKSTGYYGKSTNPNAYALQTTRVLKPDIFYPLRAHVTEMTKDDFLNNRGHAIYHNIENEIEHSINKSQTRSTALNMSLDYKISRRWRFLHQSSIMLSQADGFSAFDDRTYLAANIRTWNYGEIPLEERFNASTLPSGGIANFNQTSSTVWGIRNSLDYAVPLFDARDQFNFTIGSEFNSEKSDGFSATEPGYFPDRGKTFYPVEKSRRNFSRQYLMDALKNTVSAYSTVTYSLMNKYILRGDLRTDGSNRFGQYSNSKFLPNFSVSGRWNAYAEEWFPAGNLLSSFSFTASYGTQGNVVSAVGPNLIATYEIGINGLNPATMVPYMRIKSLPYPQLRWEKTRQLNFGADMAFWNNRLRAGVNYYRKHSVDVLDQVNIPYEYGLEFMYRNGSELFNRGVELSMSVDVVKNKNTTFTVSMNTARNFNRKDDEYPRSDLNSLLDGRGHLPGKPVSGFYSYIFDGLSAENGQPMFKNLGKSVPATKYSDPGQFLVYSGQMDPTVTLSIAPMLQYKSVSVQSQLYAVMGNTRRLNPPFGRNSINHGVPGAFANVPREYLDRWRKPGDEAHTNIPALVDNVVGNLYYVPYQGPQGINATNTIYYVTPMQAYELSDYLTANGSYLRCRNIAVSYRIPAATVRRLGVKNLSVGCNMNNVFTIASKGMKGQDPETDGVGTTALPLTRQYAFSLNAGF